MQRIIDFLNNLPVIKDFESEFMRGAICGIATLAVLLLLLQILLLLWRFSTRVKRVQELLVRQNDGNLSIAAKALESSIVDLVRGLTELQVEQARLYQKKKEYTVRVYCSYSGSALNFASASGLIKQKVFAMFADVLGVREVNKVEIRLEKLHLESDKNPTETPDQYEIVTPYRPESSSEKQSD